MPAFLVFYRVEFQFRRFLPHLCLSSGYLRKNTFAATEGLKLRFSPREIPDIVICSVTATDREICRQGLKLIEGKKQARDIEVESDCLTHTGHRV